MVNKAIGKGTTTLDYLFIQYPWLKELIISKDKKIEELERRLDLEKKAHKIIENECEHCRGNGGYIAGGGIEHGMWKVCDICDGNGTKIYP